MVDMEAAKRAAKRLEQELKRNAEAIGRILDEEPEEQNDDHST